MNKDQIRARLLEISARLTDISALEITAELATELNALNDEFEKLNNQLVALERTEANLKKGQESTRQVAPTTPAAQVVVGPSASDKFGGFKNSGEFLMAVKAAGSTGRIHERLNNAAFERNGEDGGFLVPEDISTAITKKFETAPESLWGKANVVRVSGNGLSLTLDESQPWNNGIQAYWMDEGAAYTETKPKFTKAKWSLNKVGVLVKATDELLEDATALESYIKMAAPNAIMHKVNGAIISGDGVGKPEGILGSPFTVTVNKEVGQAADSIVARNIIKMFSRMIPEARSGAAWYINAQLEEQLYMMKDDAGSFIYLAPGSQMNQSPYGLLLGRPVIPMLASIPALGDSGDIIFANLSYYYGIQKAGIKSNASIHLHFDRDITAFKFSLRLDGKCPFKTPITTEFGGHTVSGFVKLEDRA